MISRDEAQQIAQAYIRRGRHGEDWVILADQTIEKPYGWIFSYEQRRFLETGDRKFRLIGNGPILIDKNTAKVVVFGSAGSLDYWCGLYEAGKTREDSEGVIHLRFRIGDE